MNGMSMPPVPHATPIISDDTVAGADRRDRLAEGDADRLRRLQEEAAGGQHDGEREARALRRQHEERHGESSDTAITRRGPKRSASGPPKKPPALLASR